MQRKKNPAFYNVQFLKKSRKTSKDYHLWLFWLKMGILWSFSCFFLETVLCKMLGFFALHSVQQDTSFELSKASFGQFFIFFIMRGDPSDLGAGSKLTSNRSRSAREERETVLGMEWPS